MSSLIRLCCVAAAVMLALPVGASARQDIFKLKGVILDPQDARIAESIITLENDVFKRRVQANDVGVFEAKLPGGVYRLTVERPGFKKLKITTLLVNSDHDDFEIHLEPEPPGIPHGIDVPERIERQNSPQPEKINPRKIQLSSSGPRAADEWVRPIGP